MIAYGNNSIHRLQTPNKVFPCLYVSVYNFFRLQITPKILWTLAAHETYSVKIVMSEIERERKLLTYCTFVNLSICIPGGSPYFVNMGLTSTVYDNTMIGSRVYAVSVWGADKRETITISPTTAVTHLNYNNGLTSLS